MAIYIRKFLPALLAIVIIQSAAIAQVVVEKSTDKVIISGKQYYIHVVKKGETAYSISRAYGIKVDELTSENPSAVNGIKDGQSLRIPVISREPVTDTVKDNRKENTARDESKFIYHRLERGDTVFSLAKRYGVSEDDILQSNPGVEINKLSVGTEIAIPRRQFTTTPVTLDVRDKDQEKNYINYKVSKGETFSSIAEKFGLSVKELRRENKGVIFPKVDDYLKVPVAKVEPEQVKTNVVKDTVLAEKPVITEQTLMPVTRTIVGKLKGHFDVAVLMPFYFDENAQRTEIDSMQNLKGKTVKRVIQRPEQWILPESQTFLELYQGILIAADTLRSMGLDMNIHVFSIERDTNQVVDLIRSGKLDRMDLIIGPVYSGNLAAVADYASGKNIPVISPVPLRSSEPLKNRPYLYMVYPSLEVAQRAIAHRVADYYNGNFVFIHQDTARVDRSVSDFKSMIFSELSSKIAYENIKFKEFIFYNRSALSNDSINRLEHALSDKTDNIILIASEESPVMSETIMDLHTLSKKYTIRLVGYPAMREIDNLEPKYYFDMGIELYSPYWLDYNKPDVRSFLASYRGKFLTEPAENSFAWQGYDLTYYFITGLAMNGKEFLLNPGMHNPDLLESEYRFTRSSPDSGFENTRLFLIRYTNEMEVKLLDELFTDQAGK